MYQVARNAAYNFVRRETKHQHADLLDADLKRPVMILSCGLMLRGVGGSG